MKLTKKTIGYLAYLAEIYPSILIRQGKILRSRNAGKNVLTKVEIDEEFPLEFMIYDIKDFLKVVKLFNEPDVEFVGTGDSGHMVISEGGAKIRYKFSAKELYENPPDDVDYVPNSVSWQMDVLLNENEIDNIINVANVMKLDTISFTKDKIKLLRENGSDSFVYFEIDYENTPTFSNDTYPKDFFINFSTKNFIINSGVYNVSLIFGGAGKPSLAKFVRSEGDIVVWVGSTANNG